MAHRELDIATLDNAAKDYAVYFIRNEGVTLNGKVKFDRDWVILQFYNFWYKDEFEYVVERVRGYLRADILDDFNARIAKLEPRTDKVFAEMLEQGAALVQQQIAQLPEKTSPEDREKLQAKLAAFKKPLEELKATLK